MPSSSNRTLFRKKPIHRKGDEEEKDTSKRTLFLSTRATAQETKSVLQQFAKNHRTTRTKSSTGSSPATTSPRSPRDVITERKGTLTASGIGTHRNREQSHAEEEQSKGLETSSTASTTEAWSLLETPTLHSRTEENPATPQGAISASPQSSSSSRAPSPHNHTCSDNVSLADSSITTEIGFLGTSHNLTTLQAQPNECTMSCNSSLTASTWQPRSLRDLVRRDLQSDDPTIMERALQQITLDCWDEGPARSLVARAGGIMTIVNLLDDYVHHERIMVAACHALEKLSLDTDNELAVIELGGCDVLWNLANTSASGRVQEAAWAALQNCTCQSPIDQWDMQVWAQEVLPRLQNFPQQMVYAAAAAANVCVAHAEQRRVFGASGGIVAMAVALQQHWADDLVRADLAQSMTRICEADIAKEDEQVKS